MFKQLAFIGLFSLAVHGVAQAGGVVAGATEITQILNYAQLAAQYAESAQQTVTQVKQYETMLKNLKQLAPSSTVDSQAQKLWNDQNMTQVFKNLQQVVIGGEQSAYTSQNLEQKFKQMNKGYGNYAGQDFTQSYKNWSDNTLNSVKNSLAMLSSHSENFASEQGMVAELQQRSRTAQGQLEATQAGSEIGVAMVGQMQQLRQLQMAQMQTQNAFIAGQQSKSDMNEAAYRQFFNRGTTRVRTLQEINAAGGK